MSAEKSYVVFILRDEDRKNKIRFYDEAKVDAAAPAFRASLLKLKDAAAKINVMEEVILHYLPDVYLIEGVVSNPVPAQWHEYMHLWDPEGYLSVDDILPTERVKYNYEAKIVDVFNAAAMVKKAEKDGVRISDIIAVDYIPRIMPYLCDNGCKQTMTYESVMTSL